MLDFDLISMISTSTLVGGFPSYLVLDIWLTPSSVRWFFWTKRCHSLSQRLHNWYESITTALIPHFCRRKFPLYDPDYHTHFAMSRLSVDTVVLGSRGQQQPLCWDWKLQHVLNLASTRELWMTDWLFNYRLSIMWCRTKPALWVSSVIDTRAMLTLSLSAIYW